MGIPHLITHLRPYAVDTDLNGRGVIIDGPGFAYHIYHFLLSNSGDTKSPFESLPSYASIGETALTWLDEVESYGVKIKQIYFDGFLPPSKTKTRASRLVTYTRQMAAYNDSWPSMIPMSSAAAKAANFSQPPRSSVISFGPSLIQEKIPALPFLVPAVIERLQGSVRYGHLTLVQPGEADLYCARYVKENGGIALTGDSDLLVHDLGERGSVAFLKDLNVVEHLNRKSLRCFVYEIGEIVSRLGLPKDDGIRGLAYKMVMDHHATLPNLINRAKNLHTQTVDGYPQNYNEFAQEYLALAPDVHPETSNTSASEIRKTLHTLDPRISEFILQAPGLSGYLPVTHPASDDPSTLDISLPFLLDCPSRTSSWEPSTPIRLLAYGVLNYLPSTSITTACEHRRQQTKESRGRAWEVPTEHEMLVAARHLVTLVGGIKSELGLTGSAVWRAVTMHQELSHALPSGKVALGGGIYASGANVRRLTWEHIQYSSVLQGVWYSLRMLKQVLAVVNAARSGSEPLKDEYVDLMKALETLPGVGELRGFYDDLASFANPTEGALFHTLKSWIDDREGADEDSEEAEKAKAQEKLDKAERKKERKKKRKRKDGGADAEDNAAAMNGDAKKTSTNMFALLGDT